MYARPAGNPLQEAGGVAVCLLAWCESRGVNLLSVAVKETERIERKMPEDIRGSIARKRDANLFLVDDKEEHGEVT